MRRGSQSAFANPVLIGAVTVLVVLVALFLAYDANQGLPFVPTRELKVDIADGSNLVVGNDVTDNGARIGLVSALKPVAFASGQVGAQLTLKLNKADGQVPVDSTATILPRSVLGLKYVQLTKGASRQIIPDGGTLPESQTTVPVQFDDVYKTFDPKTRAAAQQTLVGAGDTLAGRGSSLNDTIQALPPLLGHLEPVARSLSDPATGLSRFFTSLNRFFAAVEPLAQVNARVLGEAATTFEAFSRDPNALEQTIAQSPSTLAAGTDSLAAGQPFLVDSATLGHYLTPATAELNQALPNINPALEAGTRTLIRTPPLDAELQQVMNALKQLAQAPGTNVGINALSSTVNTLNPVIRYLGPYQTVCNDWNYWWTWFAENFSHVGPRGYFQLAGVSVASPQAAWARTVEPLQPTERQVRRHRIRTTTQPSPGVSAGSSTSMPRPMGRRSTTRATPTAKPASAATQEAQPRRSPRPQARH